MLEGVPFVNGSPQNTFVPGLIELAVERNVLIGARRAQRSAAKHSTAPHSAHSANMRVVRAYGKGIALRCRPAGPLRPPVLTPGPAPAPGPLPPAPGGDDFKSGQTKMKSVLVDFLVGAGLKPTSIVSYNHLGNNDGMNLSAPQVGGWARRRSGLAGCVLLLGPGQGWRALTDS